MTLWIIVGVLVWYAAKNGWLSQLERSINEKTNSDKVPSDRYDT